MRARGAITISAKRDEVEEARQGDWGGEGVVEEQESGAARVAVAAGVEVGETAVGDEVQPLLVYGFEEEERTYREVGEDFAQEIFVSGE